MPDYKVGIDFGTSQTKICSSIPGGNEYIFHKFSKTKNYLFPSTFKLNSDGKCVYGLNEPNVLRYFKMNALFDDQANYQIGNATNINNLQTITQQNMESYPEIVCILFLSYCIIDVKASFSVKKDSMPEQKGNLLSRLLKNSSKKDAENKPDIGEIDDTNHYTFTIGIPTQYDYNPNEFKRRSKQYEMLYLAFYLSNQFKSREEFENSLLSSHLKNIEKGFNTIKTLNNVERMKKYKEEGLFIIAETTAGIVSLRNQLQRALNSIEINTTEFQRFESDNVGYYMTMDVGAGTTDVSFFKFTIDENKEIKMRYYASKSIPLASNYVISQYLDIPISDNRISTFDYKINQNQWNEKLENFRRVLSMEIREQIVYTRLIARFRDRAGIRKTWHYEDQPNHHAKGCRVYGGGSRFNVFNTGVIDLCISHIPGFHPDLETSTEIGLLIQANELIVNIKLINAELTPLNNEEKNELMDSLDILNISLGLAIVDFANRPDEFYDKIDWIENNEGNDRNENRVEGMAMFDIYNRDWI